MPIGVLLAAGRGQRLGGVKQLLPWPAGDGDKPLVAASFDAIASVCQEMIVVLGHNAERVAEALGPRRFHVARSDPDAEMFVSLRAGLQAARKLDADSDVLLHSADHPQVPAATLARLLQAAAGHAGLAVIPRYRGRGGHPVLIPSSLVNRILNTECTQGLRQFWREHGELCHFVSVDDAGVLADLDTPEDYARLSRSQPRQPVDPI